jgi:hypothetical protein
MLFFLFFISLVSLVSGSLRLSNSKGIVVAIITDETKSKATNVNFVLMIACNFLIVVGFDDK